MVSKWLEWINYGIMGCISLLLVLALYYFTFQPREFPLPDVEQKKINIPKDAFQRTQEEYDAVGPPALLLSFAPLSVQLPDLRKHLVFYGKNSRPDADPESSTLFFSFTNNRTAAYVSSGGYLYVMYDKKQTPPQYVFSEENAQTPLWIEPILKGNQALVKVRMKGENGQIIQEPAAYAEITFPEKEFMQFGHMGWEMGKTRVDGSLLARQKAKWYGVDQFIEDHGGEEYKEWKGKQRLDFGEGEEAYSVYVSLDECLIWQEERWYLANTVENSKAYPLMCIKRVDDRIMNFWLWDVDGKGKTILNLMKTKEPFAPQSFEQSFKFVGARTRSQFIFEINGERVLLSPADWLLFEDLSWKKLQTSQEIDDYVERKRVGPLFIFDRIDKTDDSNVIVGTIYSLARSEKAEIFIPLQQTGSPEKGGGKEKGKSGEKGKSSEKGAKSTPKENATAQKPAYGPIADQFPQAQRLNQVSPPATIQQQMQGQQMQGPGGPAMGINYGAPSNAGAVQGITNQHLKNNYPAYRSANHMGNEIDEDDEYDEDDDYED